jgi:hypothetical protein
MTLAELKQAAAVSRYWRAPGIDAGQPLPSGWQAIAGRSFLLGVVSEVPEYPIDVNFCFGRRGERDLLSCLRRSDEEITALRRAPECPDKFACPTGGCT